MGYSALRPLGRLVPSAFLLEIKTGTTLSGNEVGGHRI